MPEISLTKTAGEQKTAKRKAGGIDINGLLDDMEKAMERLQSNPQLAEMLGVDLGGMQNAMNQANEAAESEGVELDHTFLEDLLGGIQQAGYGEMTINEVRQWINDNPGMVDNLIEQQS